MTMSHTKATSCYENTTRSTNKKLVHRTLQDTLKARVALTCNLNETFLAGYYLQYVEEFSNKLPPKENTSKNN